MDVINHPVITRLTTNFDFFSDNLYFAYSVYCCF